jgi:hypothetical protein
MRIEFQIGTVLPASDSVARFVCGLAMAVNDLTLTNEQTSREVARTDTNRPGISLHHMYRLCAHYREAAKFLSDALADPRIAAFAHALPKEAVADLAALEASCTPWVGSFVETKLKPVRDVVFHYIDWSKPDLADAMAVAHDAESGIDIGSGSYAESRYGFADEVVRAAATKSWGSTEQEIASVLRELTGLVLALTRFGHAAVTAYLESRPRSVFRLSG